MRAIDADALIEKCGDWYVEEGTESGFIGTLENLLATQPTIQPEIVRCDECLYRKICSWKMQGAKFCSFAEKREVTT